MKSRTTHQIRGLTIVEALITATIIAILAAVAIPGFADYLERKRIEALAREMTSDIRSARAQSVAQRYGFVFYPRSTCYNVQKWTGTLYCACDGSSSHSVCAKSHPLYNQALQSILKTVEPPTSSIRFVASPNLQAGKWVTIENDSAGSGTTGSNAIYTDIVGTRGNQLRVRVNAAGIANICSPGGKFPGYPTC